MSAMGTGLRRCDEMFAEIIDSPLPGRSVCRVDHLNGSEH
jgi:hypothetical protein